MANLNGNSLPRQFLAQDADILPPSDDRIFKVLLTHPDAKQVLIDIVSTVIERKVVEVQLRNTELPAMDINEKAERFDINCTIDNGDQSGNEDLRDQVDVEMHCSRIEEENGNNRKNFLNKYTYYMTDLHSSQKSKGVAYEDLVRTYQVTFSIFTVFPQIPDFVSRFTMRTSKGIQLNDQINMVLIELSKLDDILKKPVDQLSSFEKWSLFLKYAPDPGHRDKINDIIKEKKEIGMAATLLQEISKDENERAHFRSRRMYETDMESNRIVCERRGEKRSDAKWKGVIAEKDAMISKLLAELEQKT